MTQNNPERGGMGEGAPILHIGLDDLLMDEDNPRFPRTAKDQQDAVRLMLKVTRSQTVNLLRDIVDRRELNPSEFPIVVPSTRTGGKYVVLEGNRRLACLLLWNNPELAGGERQYNAIRKVVEESAGPPFGAMRVVVLGSREQAVEWVRRRHTGQLNGVGTVGWNAREADNFNVRLGVPSLTSAFCRRVGDWYKDDERFVADLQAATDERYTTVARLIDRKPTREVLGYSWDGEDIQFTRTPEELKPAISRIFYDLSKDKKEGGGVWSRELNSVPDIVEYLQPIADLIEGTKAVSPDVGKVVASPTNATSSRRKAEGLWTETSEPHSKSNRTESPELPIVDLPAPKVDLQIDPDFNALDLSAFPPRTQEVLKQMRGLKVATKHEIVGVMIRVLVDLCVKVFVESVPEVKYESQTHKQIRKIILHLRPEVQSLPATSRDPLKVLYERLGSGGGGAWVEINSFLHDPAVSGGPRDVVSHYRLLEPLLVAMNQRLRQNH